MLMVRDRAGVGALAPIEYPHTPGTRIPFCTDTRRGQDPALTHLTNVLDSLGLTDEPPGWAHLPASSSTVSNRGSRLSPRRFLDHKGFYQQDMGQGALCLFREGGLGLINPLPITAEDRCIQKLSAGICPCVPRQALPSLCGSFGPCPWQRPSATLPSSHGCHAVPAADLAE